MKREYWTGILAVGALCLLAGLVYLIRSNVAVRDNAAVTSMPASGDTPPTSETSDKTTGTRVVSPSTDGTATAGAKVGRKPGDSQGDQNAQSPPFRFDKKRPLEVQLKEILSKKLSGTPYGFHDALSSRLAEIGPILIAWIENNAEDSSLRASAISVLSVHPVPGFGKVLREVAIEPNDRSVKEALVRALGTQGDPENAATLATMMRDSDGPSMKTQLITALGYTGTKEALPAIEAILKSDSDLFESMTDAVKRAKQQIEVATSDDKYAASLPLLHHHDPEMRRWALFFLGKLNPPDLSTQYRHAVESLRHWPEWKRKMHLDVEVVTLKALKRSGGQLLPSEERFLIAIGNQLPFELPK